MIFDQEGLLSDQQAITGTARSTNIIDLGAQGVPHGDAAALQMDVGLISAIPILIQVTQAFNTLTSLDIAIQNDGDVAFGSPVTLFEQNILLADLVPGKKINYDILPNGLKERYLSINYTVNGSNPSTGKIMAGIVAAVQNN